MWKSTTPSVTWLSRLPRCFMDWWMPAMSLTTTSPRWGKSISRETLATVFMCTIKSSQWFSSPFRAYQVRQWWSSTLPSAWMCTHPRHHHNDHVYFGTSSLIWSSWHIPTASLSQPSTNSYRVPTVSISIQRSPSCNSKPPITSGVQSRQFNDSLSHSFSVLSTSIPLLPPFQEHYDFYFKLKESLL